MKILKLAAIWLLVLTFTVKIASFSAYSAEISVSAQSAVVLSVGTNSVVFEKNSRKRLPMASTTKIMTAIVAIEAGKLERTVSVSKNAVGVEGSSIYLYENEKLTMRELLYAMMLESANDAAAAIAIEVAGSIDAFAVLMNQKAERLGLSDTSFENPHGLDGENHYTTAYDLALIASYAMKNNEFREIVSTYKKLIPMNNGDGTRLLINHNRLLRSYDGAIGVKTGFTKKSGRCLVTSAERDGVTLVAVTLNAPDDWNDHKKMLDFGFSSLERIELIDKNGICGSSPVVGGVSEYVGYYSMPFSAELAKGEHSIRTVIEMQRFHYAPIEKGEILGRAVFYDGDKEIGSTELYASEYIEKRVEKRTLWDFIRSIFGF